MKDRNVVVNYGDLNQIFGLICDLHRLDSLSDEEKIKAEQASMLTARYLWNFLSGMTSKHKLRIAA